ncbi:prenyltransferase [Haloarcula pellucida]|uniref:Prenyltransferase n=1 Tax=Haloarcula pellucida TaxID=1427151 RepID=A0A830GLN9_9EURY|nr:prenyltransferase [Halomicroarcula pellucida]MBX0348388.1 prenyltransferase [Halomicroarcula pellucida]GGN93604.1 prenyltransferase [Halomicroarcula pellucida]
MSTVTDRLSEVAPSEDTRPGYLFWLSRPRFWLYQGGPVVVVVTYAADGPGELFSPLAIALFLYFTVPANVFLYGVNDVFDRDVDEHNPKKDEGREVSYRGDSVVVAAIVGSGLLAAAFLPWLPTLGVVALLAWAALSVEYSAPPLRFKTTPFLDSLSNGLYILPGVVAYAAIEGVAPPASAVAGAWLWTMGMHTFSAIPDIEPDREAGIQTTATYLGESNTYYYCVMCWLTAAFVFTYTHWVFGALLLVYPGLVFGILAVGVDIDEAYWWYPAINSLVGMAFTLIGLWVMLYG